MEKPAFIEVTLSQDPSPPKYLLLGCHRVTFAPSFGNLIVTGILSG
jgi:hypothetical protein